MEPRLNVMNIKCQVRHSKFTEEFTLCDMGSHVTLGRQFLKSNICLVDFGRAKLLLQGKDLDFVDDDGLKIEQKIISCNTGVTENNRKSLNLSIANSASVESLSDKGRSGDVNLIRLK